MKNAGQVVTRTMPASKTCGTPFDPQTQCYPVPLARLPLEDREGFRSSPARTIRGRRIHDQGRPDHGHMSRISVLFRTTAVRLSALYLVPFSLCAAFLVFYVTGMSERLLQQQTREAIRRRSGADRRRIRPGRHQRAGFARSSAGHVSPEPISTSLRVRTERFLAGNVAAGAGAAR